MAVPQPTDLLIRCQDPATERVFEFTRAQRNRFSYDSVVNGGDRSAVWTVDCDQIPGIGLPDLASRVQIINVPRNKVVWSGTLRKPVEHTERGRLVSVDLAASGYGFAPLIPFGEPTRFGPSTGMATLTGIENTGSAGFGGGNLYNVITDLKDIMLFGLSHMPLITGTQSHIATTGLFPLGNTEDFRNRTPPDMWTAACALTASLGTPYYWMVYDDGGGAPCLFFLAEMPVTPEYFERGTSKSMALTVDADEISNLISIPFRGNGTIYAPDLATASPIDYSAIFDIQGHCLAADAEILTYEDTQAFAAGLLTKFNRRLVHEGEIVLDQDVRAHFTGVSSAEFIPICEVRAGKTIELLAPRTPYHTSSVEYVFIRSARYDEDQCQMILSAQAISPEGRDARLLQLLANRGMVWASSSPRYNSPGPDLFKVAASGTISDNAQQPATVTISGAGPGNEGVGPGPSFGGGYKPPAPPANMLPKTTDVPDGTLTSPPIIATLGAGAQSTVDNPYFGKYGIQDHPESNPPERINIPASFGTADAEGDLTDGERLVLPDIQAGFYDTLTIVTLDSAVCSVEVHIDVYHWDSATRDTDVIVIPLVADYQNRILLDDSTSELSPIILNHGDRLHYRVVGADSNQILFVGISGWKLWAWFPRWLGDPNVPGNA